MSQRSTGQFAFDKLFSQDLLQIASTILKLKRSYDNSVPKLLSDNGYYKQGSKVYVNPIKNIILFYNKGDPKKKRPEAFNELLRVGDMYGATSPQLIYGHLSSKVEDARACDSSGTKPGSTI